MNTTRPDKRNIRKLFSRRRNKRCINVFLIWRFGDETKPSEHRKTDLFCCHKFC